MTRRARPGAAPVISAALLSVLFPWGGAAWADDKLACVAASEKAQQLRDEGKLKQARQQMLACARDTCPQAIRKDCLVWLNALDASLPSIVLSAQDASKHDVIHVRVTLDEKPLVESLDGRAITLDPGPHLLRFEMEGQKPVEQRVLIREGEQRRAISVQFPSANAATEPATAAKETAAKETTKAPIPTAAIVLGAVGLVGLASFAFFGVTGKNDLATLRDTCGVTHSCAQSDVDATRTKLIVADVSLGASIIALGVATGLVLFRGSSAPAASPSARAIRVDAFPIAGGAAATLGGRF